MRAKISASSASTWQICIIAMALIVMTACSALAGKAITKIDVTNTSDRTLITVQGNESLRMMPFSSTVGRYLGFQFPASLAVKSRVVKVQNGGVFCVKYSNFRSFPPCARVVVNTSASLRYSTEWSADKKQVKINIFKSGFKPVNKKVSHAAPASKPKDVRLTVLPPMSSLITATVGTPATSAEPVIKPRVVAAPLVRMSAESREVYAAMRNVGSSAKAAFQMAAARPQVTSRVLGMVETERRQPAEITARPMPAPVQMAIASAPVEIQKRVSLNFLGADINDVLKALALQSGENIVASKDVKGDVTVSLSNVSMEEALEYITTPNGLAYTVNNGTYLVAVQSNVAAVAVVVPSSQELVSLNYANPEDVAKLLTARFPGLKVIQFAQKGQQSQASTVVVSQTTWLDKTTTMRDVPPNNDMIALIGQQADIDQAKELIKQIDEKILKQKESGKKWMDDKKREYYKVKYANAEQLSFTLMQLVPDVAVAFAPSNKWGLVGFESGKSEDGIPTVTRVFSDNPANKPNDSKDSNNSQNQNDSKKESNPDKSGDQLTAATSRTLIIIGSETAIKEALKLADELDIKSPQINIAAKITSIDKTGEDQLGMKWAWDKISFSENPIGTWTRGAANFSTVLSALITKGNATLLASPNLLCLEEKPGVFFVGDEVTYVSSVSASASGEKTYQTDTKQAGVNLTVVSNVSSDGYITLYLHSEVSTIALTTAESVTLPTVSRRFTDQIVRVKDGDTIAIGGLIRSDEIANMSKVPVLGDLPFFGKLFQHKDKKTEKTEVVMFITANVVKD